MEYKVIKEGKVIYCPNCEIHGIERLAKFIVKHDAFGNIETPLCEECLKKLVSETEI